MRQPWRIVDGLFCAGGPVDGCLFALQGGAFGAPGLVLVKFGARARARCEGLIDSSGYVALTFNENAANGPH